MSTTMAGTKSNTKAIKIRTGLVTAVMILLAIISLLPIYVLIVNATRASVDITGSGVSLIPHLKLFENIGTLNEWASSNKVQYNALIGYKNSGIIAFSTTFLTVLFSCMTAYGLVVYDFKLKNVAYTINTIISNDKLADYGAKYAAIMLSIIPVVVVYFIFSRFIVEGVALGGVKE